MFYRATRILRRSFVIRMHIHVVYEDARLVPGPAHKFLDRARVSVVCIGSLSTHDSAHKEQICSLHLGTIDHAPRRAYPVLQISIHR